MKTRKVVERIVPPEAKAFFAVAKSMKAQGSLEYIMMIAAASLIIVIALAMIVKLKGAVGGSVSVNGVNMSVTGAISKELATLSQNIT